MSTNVEYDSESELTEDYKKFVISSTQNLSIATEYLFESLVNEAVMGYAFQTHFEAKFPVNFDLIFIENYCNPLFYFSGSLWNTERRQKAQLIIS